MLLFGVQQAHMVPDSGPFHQNPHSNGAPPRPLTPGKWLWWKATHNPSSIYTLLSHRMFTKFYMCNLFPSCYFFPALRPFFMILCFGLQAGRDGYRDQIAGGSRCVYWNHLQRIIQATLRSAHYVTAYLLQVYYLLRGVTCHQCDSGYLFTICFPDILM